MSKYLAYDTEKKGWLYWGIPNNTPEVPLMLTKLKANASTFSAYEIEKLKQGAKEAGLPDDYWVVEEVKEP